MSQTPEQLDLRVGKSYLATGIIGAVFFAGFGGWSVFAAALNVDGSFLYPIPTAIFAGVFWGGWFAYSLYIVAAYCRFRLTVTPESITEEGVFLIRTAAVSDITTAKWTVRGGSGKLVVRTPKVKITIYFDSFTKIEREQLTVFLRHFISPDCQENWDAFARTYHATRQQNERCRENGILCMLFFLGTAAVCLFCWHIRYGSSFLWVGVLCLLAALWYAFRIMKFVPDSDAETTA